jgi:hypothetical protein
VVVQAAETLELVKELVEQRDAAQDEAFALESDEEVLVGEEDKLAQVVSEDEESLREQDAVIQDMSIELEEVVEESEKKDEALEQQAAELAERDKEIALLTAKVDEAAQLMQTLVGGGGNLRRSV